MIKVIIAFIGAGISQESGIPTFENQKELRNKLTREYANSFPDEYNEVIQQLKANVNEAKPNDAHIALAEYKIPIITMNIDGLHKDVGSDALELHGTLPDEEELDNASLLVAKPILYGDIAPNYNKAIQMVSQLGKGDTLLVVGASDYTGISRELKEIAYINGAQIIEIQEQSATNVRKYLDNQFIQNK